MSYSPGVYSYIYTATRPGDITINVIRYKNGGILYEYYSNQYGTGTRAHSSYESNINVDFGVGPIFGSVYDYAYIKMYFRFLAPATGTYTFRINVDDDFTFYLDGSMTI